MNPPLTFAVLLAAALPLHSAPLTGRLTVEPITVPGLTNVSAVSLSEDGTLLGYTASGPAGNLRGFLAAGTNFTALPLPAGSTDLQPWGMDSAGTIVGEVDYARGFILRGTNFTLVEFPAEGVTETLLTGINDQGLITGTAFGDAGPFAFTLQETNFALLTLPGASRSFAYDVNRRGVVVGQYRQGAGDTFGFWKRGTNTHVALQVPGADRTIAYGINNNDVIVGAYRRTGGTTFHGFIYEAGIYTLLDVPDSTWTVPSDVNDDGVIVGYYRDAAGATLPFRAARALPRVRYRATTFDVPGKPHTLAFGLNDRGEVVGQWYGPEFAEGGGFRRGMDHRFELFPPPAGYEGVAPQSINRGGAIVGQAYPDGFLRTGDTSRPITIADHSEVFLRAINASGVFGGSAVGDFGDVPVIARDGTNLTVLPLPDSVAAGVAAITDAGVVGGYRLQTAVVDSTTNSFTSGFILEGATATAVRVPGSYYTSVDHVDSRGAVFGAFLARTTGNTLRSYVLEAGEFTEIDLVLDRPEARRPSITDRNDSGALVGFYTLPDGSYHGFVAYREDALLSQVHGDIGFDFSVAEGWNPHVHNHGTDTEFTPWEAVLVVNPGARVPVPAGAGYGFLGRAGEPVWILPQVHREGLLDLGVGAEAVEPGTFQNDRFRLELKAFSGPGEFSLFLVDGFGKPAVFLNTRDGITPEDVYDVMAGSHVHMNWGFTRPGTYTVTLQAAGVLADGTPTTPGPRTYTFLVLEAGAPSLSVRRLDGGRIRISFPTEPGVTYHLQRLASWETGSWQDGGEALVGTGAEGQWTVQVEGMTGFFRGRTNP